MDIQTIEHKKEMLQHLKSGFLGVQKIITSMFLAGFLP